MAVWDERDRALTRLGELRGQFADRLRTRLERLAEQVATAHRNPTSGTLAEAIATAHRLAGTAGSFGYVAVGESAAGLERSLQRIAGGQDDWEAALAALERAQASGP